MASEPCRGFNRSRNHLGGIGDLGLLVGGRDCIDEFSVLVLEITGKILRRALGQLVHVLRAVGPQGGDGVDRGPGDIQFGGQDGTVGQVGLEGPARERSRRDERAGCRGNHDLGLVTTQPAPASRRLRGCGFAGFLLDSLGRGDLLSGVLGEGGLIGFGVGQITCTRLLIFHCVPSFFAVTNQRLPPSIFLPSGSFVTVVVATTTFALPSSFQFSIPRASTVPVVGSARAT